MAKSGAWKQFGLIVRWLYMIESPVYKINWRLFPKVETFWEYSSLTLPNCSSLIFNSPGPVAPLLTLLMDALALLFKARPSLFQRLRTGCETASCCKHVHTGLYWRHCVLHGFQRASDHAFCNRLMQPLVWMCTSNNWHSNGHNLMCKSAPGLLLH